MPASVIFQIHQTKSLTDIFGWTLCRYYITLLKKIRPKAFLMSTNVYTWKKLFKE